MKALLKCFAWSVAVLFLLVVLCLESGLRGDAHCNIAEGTLADEVVAPYVQVGADDGEFGSGVVLKLRDKVVVLTAKHLAKERGQHFALSKRAAGGERRWDAEQVWDTDDRDLALLEPENPDGLRPAALLAGDVELGEDVWYVGTPAGVHASLEKSIVNCPFVREGKGRGVLRVNGNGWRGNSGGPCYVRRGGHYVVAGVVVRLAFLSERAPLLCERDLAKWTEGWKP